MVDDLMKLLGLVGDPRFGVIAILCAILYGLHKEWWVPGFVHRELKTRYDADMKEKKQEVKMWQSAALAGTNLAERLVDVAARQG